MSRIEGYTFGGAVVDGNEETRDLIVLPHRVVRNWWRMEGHTLVLADLEDVLDELPERLVVGTGADGRMRPRPRDAREATGARDRGRGPPDPGGRPALQRARPRADGRRLAPHLLGLTG